MTGLAQADELLPIGDAARRLGRSPWTLKRLYEAGHIPAVLINGLWFVPASFVAAVLSSPRPAQAGSIEATAAAWFAARTAEAVTA